MGDAVFWLFIDDLRDAPSEEWMVARSSSEAIALAKERRCPARVSFDHDLGGDDTAMVVARWLVDTDLDCSGRFIPDHFNFSVHSANPVGAANIQGLLAAYLSYRAKSRNAAEGYQ
ncbi:cyclic-phosphate processing receiver domain-containing protein [Paraburkholderia sp. BCC1876]|uniref:cyclic-phosphate processing receiver domain-containing protein n=1 Tax=Paraburkholderia sp. BCC1876 TaxID=2676303 RepID=UPI003263054E